VESYKSEACNASDDAAGFFYDVHWEIYVECKVNGSEVINDLEGHEINAEKDFASIINVYPK
jgi:hypothetical protein